MQYPLTQQVRLGPAIPHSLDQLYPAYLPFTLSSAPGGGQRQLDCFVVLTETPRGGLELLQPRTAGFMAPGIKTLHITLTDDVMEPLLELVPLGKSRIDLEETVKLLPFRDVQSPVRPED